eukprot:CAMPEP_0177651176 /NCGR_PEP_ID=MMETSP0447-20121125/12385_1 /TAXON_ID=0 /ORGANISM="Stygamoeba regulata, Strain BSH-02190019" /LENGTH=249 /DNA_ID=CAMNT_0019154193 /DNA_START=248 /DNA_END=997 /DNA_ORIENTATION=+
MEGGGAEIPGPAGSIKKKRKDPVKVRAEEKLRQKSIRKEMKDLFQLLASVLQLHPKSTLKTILLNSIKEIQDLRGELYQLKNIDPHSCLRMSAEEERLFQDLIKTEEFERKADFPYSSMASFTFQPNPHTASSSTSTTTTANVQAHGSAPGVSPTHGHAPGVSPAHPQTLAHPHPHPHPPADASFIGLPYTGAAGAVSYAGGTVSYESPKRAFGSPNRFSLNFDPFSPSGEFSLAGGPHIYDETTGLPF